jgi:uncharacterized lipoprotein YehR (DUF1307 family)
MKTMKRVLSLALVVVMVFALVSCSKKLSGTYASGELLGSGVTYTFKGSDVTITTKVLGFEKTFAGEYEIYEDDNGAEKIKFTFEDSDASKYSGSFSFSEGDNSITIGGVTYNKK